MIRAGGAAVLLGPEWLLLHVEDDLLEGAVLDLVRLDVRRLEHRSLVVPRPQDVHQLELRKRTFRRHVFMHEIDLP